jgi:hypothetical protein
MIEIKIDTRKFTAKMATFAATLGRPNGSPRIEVRPTDKHNVFTVHSGGEQIGEVMRIPGGRVSSRPLYLAWRDDSCLGVEHAAGPAALTLMEAND